MTQYQYKNLSFDKVAELLEVLAKRHLIEAFSFREEPIPLHIALDEAGPLSWALVLHADAMARMAGLASIPLHSLPVGCQLNPDAPFGNQAVIQKGTISLTAATMMLDSALESAACLGMQSYGYSPEEWAALPAEQRVIPIEPYLADLQSNWITEALESSDQQSWVQAWPTLLNTELLSALMSDNNQAQLNPLLNIRSAPSL